MKHGLSLTAVRHASSALFAITFSLCVVFDLLFPQMAMYQIWLKLVPGFDFQTSVGKNLFDTNCAQCHGRNGIGSDSGPPLLHEIHNPGHHGDASFYRAVKSGSPQHHWNFGNMPPVPAVSEAQVKSVIKYIRALQTANGIGYKKHMM